MKKLILSLILLLVTCCMFAQSSVDGDALFKKAEMCYNTGDFKSAEKLLLQVSSMSAVNPDIREKAQDLLVKCRKDIRREPVLKVSEHNLNFISDGDFKELNVSSTNNWAVNHIASWCTIVEKSRNYLKIWCEPNGKTVSRSGELTITSSDKEVVVHLHQDPGKEKRGHVYFRTDPHNAYLESSDGSSGYSSGSLVFVPGEYSVKISKEGYESQEVSLIMKDTSNVTRFVDVTLNPLFGKLEPVVTSEDGKPLEHLEFRIGGVPVNITDYSNAHSFDDKETIVYYGFYKEGVVPLNPGVYELVVSADGYETKRLSVDIKKGETLRQEIELKSIMGRMLVRDVKDAEGAVVHIPELKMYAHVGDTLEVPVGNYHIEVKKKHYMLDDGILEAEVLKGQLTTLDASMTRMVEMLVSTEGGGERVYVNGDIIKRQHPVHRLMLTDGEYYKVEVTKDGFWHFADEFKVEKNDTLFDYRDLKLEPVDTLRLDSDDPSLLIVLKKKGEKKSYDYAQGARTPTVRREKTELLVPYGKYKLTLIRENEPKKSRRVAYRGNVRFTEKNDSKYVRSWMIPSFGSMRIISGEAVFYPEYNNVPIGQIPIPLKANIFELPLFKGMSTSIAEGAMIYTDGVKDLPADLPKNHYTTLMPAISGPLMNYDFRIGGGFTQYFDISALLTYTYYLEFDSILRKYIKNYDGSDSFDHFEGHDFFAGLEFGTRFKGLNFYLRAGIQNFKGKRLYYYHSEPAGGSEGRINNEWVTKDMPVDQNMFVVKVGFDIGGRGAKGQNILRVF